MFPSDGAPQANAEPGTAVALPTIGMPTPRAPQGLRTTAKSSPPNSAGHPMNTDPESLQASKEMMMKEYSRPRPRQGSAKASNVPMSAREPRDTAHEEGEAHYREEELIRGVYRKHAQRFFEDIRENFAREIAILRKQAVKAVKGGFHNDSTASLQSIGQLSSATYSTVDSGAAAHANLVDRVHKHEMGLTALSNQMQSDMSIAKKACLTPVWKERSLKELAQGELKAVCASEVDRAISGFAKKFAEQEVPSALQKLADSGKAPWEILMKQELAKLGGIVSEEFAKLAANIDDLSTRTQKNATSTEDLSTRMAAMSDAMQQAHDADMKQYEALSAHVHKVDTAFTSLFETQESRFKQQHENLQADLKALKKASEDVGAKCDTAIKRTDEVATDSKSSCAAVERRVAAAEQQSVSAKEHANLVSEAAKEASLQAKNETSQGARAHREEVQRLVDEAMAEAREMCSSATGNAAVDVRNSQTDSLESTLAQCNEARQVAEGLSRRAIDEATHRCKELQRSLESVRAEIREAAVKTKAELGSEVRAACRQIADDANEQNRHLRTEVQAHVQVAEDSRAQVHRATQIAEDAAAQVAKAVSAVAAGVRVAADAVEAANKDEVAIKQHAASIQEIEQARQVLGQVQHAAPSQAAYSKTTDYWEVQWQKRFDVEFEQRTSKLREQLEQSLSKQDIDLLTQRLGAVEDKMARGMDAAKIATHQAHASSDSLAKTDAQQCDHWEAMSQSLERIGEQGRAQDVLHQQTLDVHQQTLDSLTERVAAAERELIVSQGEFSRARASLTMHMMEGLVERIETAEHEAMGAKENVLILNQNASHLSGRLESVEHEAHSARSELKVALSSLSQIVAREAEKITKADFESAMGILNNLAEHMVESVSVATTSEGAQSKESANQSSKLSALEHRLKDNEAQLEALLTMLPHDALALLASEERVAESECLAIMDRGVSDGDSEVHGLLQGMLGTLLDDDSMSENSAAPSLARCSSGCSDDRASPSMASCPRDRASMSSVEFDLDELLSGSLLAASPQPP